MLVACFAPHGVLFDQILAPFDTDALNVLLAATAWNLRKWLRLLRRYIQFIRQLFTFALPAPCHVC